MNLNAAVSMIYTAQSQVKQEQYKTSKRLEEISSWKKDVNHQQEMFRRERSAKDFKEDIELSIEASKSSLLEDKEEKWQNKPLSSIQKISVDSSTQVKSHSCFCLLFVLSMFLMSLILFFFTG